MMVAAKLNCRLLFSPSAKENDRDVLKSGQQSFSEKMVTLATARKIGV